MKAPESADESGPPNSPVRKFARFFKTYALSLGVIVAALPLGLTWTNFLDHYKPTSSILNFTASLVSYLCVVGVFGARRHIGQIVFRVRRTITAKEGFARVIYSTTAAGNA